MSEAVEPGRAAPGYAAAFRALNPVAKIAASLLIAVTLALSVDAASALTALVLSSTDGSLPPGERVAAWEAADERVVQRAHTTLREITAEDDVDLARLSVGLRVVRTMLSTP